MCTGKLPLAQAQREIAADWTQAYIKYVGPLPTGTNQAASQGPADGACPANAPIKVSRTGIYHLPGDSYYTRTKAISCYATPRDAETAGFRASKH